MIYPRQVYSLCWEISLAYFIFFCNFACFSPSTPVISPHPAELNLVPPSSVKASGLWICVAFTTLTTHLACMCRPMYPSHMCISYLLESCTTVSRQVYTLFSLFFLFLHIYLAFSTDDCAGDFEGCNNA